MRKVLLIGLALAVGPGVITFGQTLGGSWETDVTFDMTGAAWWWPADYVSKLIIEYVVEDWTFGSETDIRRGRFHAQYFRIDGVLGPFTLSSDVSFHAGLRMFTELDVDTSLSMGGVTFGAEFELRHGGEVNLVLTASGVIGDVSVDVEAWLGRYEDCGFDFDSLRLEAGFPFCCADVGFAIQFSVRHDFFQAAFWVDDIAIENLSWLSLRAGVAFGLFYGEDKSSEKYAWFRPEIDLGVIECDYGLYFRLDADGGGLSSLLIDGIIFDGMEIACEIGGVQFTGITYFGPTIWMEEGRTGQYGYFLPSILCGYEDMGFFEAYQIATTDDGCCGPFSFDVTGFFEEDVDTLFDFSYIVANFEIQVSTQFTFGMGIETDLVAGTVNDLTFTFIVEF